MGKTKAIFFDVDGTIVTDEHVIPESARRALYEAHEAGHMLLVNTGRPYRHVEPQIKALPFDGFVCSLGSYIFFRGERIYHYGFTPEESRAIRDHGKRCGMQMLFESERAILGDTSNLNPMALHEYEWLTSIGVPGLPDDGENFFFDKFVFWPGPDGDKEAFCAPYRDMLDFTDRAGNMVEVVRKGFSKAYGLEKALELLHIPPEDSFAIGDSTNDLAMLRAANTAILMGNAPPELWGEADFVTAPIDEDGLYKALRHYDLI